MSDESNMISEVSNMLSISSNRSIELVLIDGRLLFKFVKYFSMNGQYLWDVASDIIGVVVVDVVD